MRFKMPPKNSAMFVGRRASVCLFMVGMALLVGCGSERAKWNLAKAMNLRAEGELEEAISLVQVAMEQSPGDGKIRFHLAKLLSENGQGEFGVDLCNCHLSRFPDDPQAHATRRLCLQYLGRFDETLADYKRGISGHVSKTSMELNNLAYFRALANEDIEKAAKEIQKAIDLEEESFQGIRWGVPLRIRTVICAAMISRHIDRRQEVLVQLDKYAAVFETSLNRLERQALSLGDDDSENRNRREFVQKNMALLLAARALVNEDLGKQICVDADRRRMVEIGFPFEEMVDELPNDMACLATLETSCFFLDTRGFVAGRLDWSSPLSVFDLMYGKQISYAKKMGDYRSALNDLDLAVLAAEFQQQALNTSLFNLYELSPRLIAREKQNAQRMTAVLLFHRMEVHRRGGNEVAARKDENRMESLGFPSDSKLF